MAKISNFSPEIENEELYLETIAPKDPSEIAGSIIDAARQCLGENSNQLDWLKFRAWYRVIEFSNVDLFHEVLSG